MFYHRKEVFNSKRMSFAKTFEEEERQRNRMASEIQTLKYNCCLVPDPQDDEVCGEYFFRAILPGTYARVRPETVGLVFPTDKRSEFVHGTISWTTTLYRFDGSKETMSMKCPIEYGKVYHPEKSGDKPIDRYGLVFNTPCKNMSRTVKFVIFEVTFERKIPGVERKTE